MEPREAIEILKKMRDKFLLDTTEKKAIFTAMGVLDSAAFTKNRIKGIIAKRKSKLDHISRSL